MPNNPVKKITAEQRQMLVDGSAKIVFTGTLTNEGDDQQPISVYVSDGDGVSSSTKCPLIFRITFTDGAASANRVDFLYMTGGKEFNVDGKALTTYLNRGEDFEIVLHVQTNTVQLEVNGFMEDITPTRPIGYDGAKFLFVTGNGMENSSIDIQNDTPWGKTKK